MAVKNRPVGWFFCKLLTDPAGTASPPGLDPCLAPLDPARIRQLHATIRTLPAPMLEGFSKAFRKRFQVPADAPSIADRICQQRHHDWIEAFLVQHQQGHWKAVPSFAALQDGFGHDGL